MDDDNRIKVDTGQDESEDKSANSSVNTEDTSTEDKEPQPAGTNAKETADSAAQESADNAAAAAEDTDTAEAETADKDNADKDKKSFFSRKKDKEKEAMQEKINALQDRVTRQMAEFDNYRKRTDKEKEQMFSNGESSVLEKMLPIVDNFERGFATVDEEDKDDAFVKGMHKVYEQLVKQLTDLGVTPIDAEGKDFDPDYHNAVMQVESDKYESGKVAQELQKGYMYHGRVLRHSMVSVVK